jgi:hypothetical protein
MSKNVMKRGNVTMFGKHVEAAEATILFVKYHSGGYHGEGDLRNSADGYATFEVILEVRTQDGQTFRTDIKQYFSLRPRVGDVVKVEYDTKSKKVKVVTKGDARYDVRAFVQAADLADKAKRDAILSVPAGTPLPQTLDQASQRAKERTEDTRLELEEHKKLCIELLLSGSEGTATVLRIWERGASVPPLVRYVLKVEVRPLLDGALFTCSLRAFLDPRTKSIVAGSTVPVRYDPQDTSRIILQET